MRKHRNFLNNFKKRSRFIYDFFFLEWLCACDKSLAATDFTLAFLLVFKSLLAIVATFLLVCFLLTFTISSFLVLLCLLCFLFVGHLFYEIIDCTYVPAGEDVEEVLLVGSIE